MRIIVGHLAVQSFHSGITECLETQNWVDETVYEVRGVIVGDANLVSEAPRKGRENISQKVLNYLIVLVSKGDLKVNTL